MARSPRKKDKKLRAGMVARTQGAGMFGETISQVLEVRPVVSKRGGGAAGDEAVVLTYRRNNKGKRTSRGKVDIMPAEEAYEVFKKA